MKKYFILLLTLTFLIIGCSGDGEASKDESATIKNDSGLSDFEFVNGIGPIKEKLSLGPIDEALAQKGAESFKIKCAACHKLDERYIGPAQRYVFERRSPEYILNMILNPDEMTKKHPTGYKLLAEYLAPMTNMNLTLDEAKAVLEYFRVTAKEGREKNISEVPVFKNK